MIRSNGDDLAGAHNDGPAAGLRIGVVWALIASLVGLFLASGLVAAALFDLSRFPGHFIEQDSWQMFFFLGAGAGLYVGVLAVVVLSIRASLGGLALLVAVTLSLVAFVLALTTFEAAALYFREDPPGKGRQLAGAEYGSFVRSAEVAFFALYAAALVLAAGIGRVLASWQVGAMTLAATALFMLRSFSVVEFVNACNIGQPVLLSAGGC